MAFYLIDYENIKKISGCNTLSEQDTIVFFYSQNANSLSFDLHIELSQTLAKKEYFSIRCGGKNALDFQLSSYVGYLMAKFPDENIFIVSQDKGFEHFGKTGILHSSKTLAKRRSKRSKESKLSPKCLHTMHMSRC